MAARTLVSMRRRPVAADVERYEEAWGDLRAAVREQSAHAWRFRARGDDRSFIEFLEFGAAGDPRTDRRVAEALLRLESIAPGAVEEWTDAEEPGK